MATKAVLEHGRAHLGASQPPILEVGSRIQPGYEQESPRDLHTDVPPEDYVGIDIEEGEGVDAVLDLCHAGAVDELGRGRFGVVHCHCVLEHVPEVFALARSMEQLLRPGGTLYVSVPFAWRVHRIPVDMWRFTPQSLDYLFPHVAFDPERCAISTRSPDARFPIDEAPELGLGSSLREQSAPMRFAIKALRRLKLDRGLFRERALLLESNLMMVGTRKDEPTYRFFPEQYLPGETNAP